MATAYSPKIITDGLVLCLDAGDSKSYSGSGTTWVDRSASNNGALTNGPTFDSANGGIINFDGVNDYVQINYGGDFTTNSYTVGFFARHNGARNARRTMLGFSNGGDYAYKVLCMQIWDSNRQYLSFVGNNSGYNYHAFNLPDDFSNWHYFTTVITPSNIQTYVNGVSYYNSSSITKRGTFDRILLGTRVGDYWKGWMSGVSLYNKALTSEEVLQNYNATKGRFGL